MAVNSTSAWGKPVVVAGEDIDRRHVTPGWHQATGMTLTITDVDAGVFFVVKQFFDCGDKVHVVSSYFCGDMFVTLCDGHTVVLAIRKAGK